MEDIDFFGSDWTFYGGAVATVVCGSVREAGSIAYGVSSVKADQPISDRAVPGHLAVSAGHHADLAGRQPDDSARAVMTTCVRRSACARSNWTKSIAITMSSSASAKEAAPGLWSTW